MLHATKIHLITLPISLNTFVNYCVYGVPLFFVLSAFSLAYGYSGRNRPARWKTEYAIRRFFRIAPLFYTMIAAWTLYKVLLGGSPFTAIEYVLNTTFVFGLVPGYQSSIVPAGWSIGVEMCFYALLPLLIKYVNSLPRAIFGFPAALCISFTFTKIATLFGWSTEFSYRPNIFNNMPYFIFGILSYHLYARLISTGRVRQCSNILLAVALGLALVNVAAGPMPVGYYTDAPPPLAATAGWAVVFGLLVTSQALMPHKIIANRVMLFLGAISFSLYLVHPLVIYALPVLPWIETLSVEPAVKGLFAWAFAFIAVVPVAWLTFKFIEVPGQTLGKLLTARRQSGEFDFAFLRRFDTPKKRALEDQS